MRSSIECFTSRPAGARTLPAALLMAAVLAVTSCSSGDRASNATEWLAQVDTVSDTVIVRTLAGSEWGSAKLVPEVRIGAIEGADHEMFGEIIALAIDATGNIYSYDRQVPALRKYAADGRYLATLGRKGGGPGEYANSDGGLVALSDGRIVLRDPGNARLTVYGPDGDHVESWPARNGLFTSTPIFPAADGGFYNPIGDGLLVRHAPDGTPVDTLTLPVREIETPTLTAQIEGMRQVWNLPFAASTLWTFHPDGYYVSAVNDQYAINLLRRDGLVLQMAMAAEPVSLSPRERAGHEERVIRAMRSIDPSWRWSGPPIPHIKPIIRTLYAGEDGRIWVRLYQPGEQVHSTEPEPSPARQPPLPVFREPIVFDVFAKDGRYQGRVSAPADFSTSPRPIFRGDHVWSTVRDDLEIQYIVRYRIVPDA